MIQCHHLLALHVNCIFSWINSFSFFFILYENMSLGASIIPSPYRPIEDWSWLKWIWNVPLKCIAVAKYGGWYDQNNLMLTRTMIYHLLCEQLLYLWSVFSEMQQQQQQKQLLNCIKRCHASYKLCAFVRQRHVLKQMENAAFEDFLTHCLGEVRKLCDLSGSYFQPTPGVLPNF